MSLEDYTRKRSFNKTPEPLPSPPRPESAVRRFYVQRHHARRLHYDFRLEIGGALKSWAVPKGPTLDPSEKRLAVMVEDHPLEYGDFEGNIPEGSYGAGSVMVWDRGFYELVGDAAAEQQIERGDLKFRLHGEKLRGEFALVRMKNRGKGNEWLLLKKKDSAAQPGWDPEQHPRSALTGRTQEEIARGMPPFVSRSPTARNRKNIAMPSEAVRGPMPASIVPMQAFSAGEPPEGPDWLYEVKWDGVRAICFLQDQKIRLVSRNGNPADAQYPELSVVPHYVAAREAILDGEIAVLDAQGRPRFELIQPRIMVSDPNAIAQLSRTRPVVYFIFDLLYLDGYDLRQAALLERKRILASILEPCPVLRYSEHFAGSGREILEASRRQGLEGIMAKRADSRYEPRRSRDWLKIKIVSQQEFVICGYTHGDRGGYFGALVLGVYDQGKLVWAGNVGTGFDQPMLERVYAMLQPLVSPRCPFPETPAIPQKITWVRPERVCTVKFSEWTQDGKLRAPVFLGMRLDAEPRDCVREAGPGNPEKQRDAALRNEGNSAPQPPKQRRKTRHAGSRARQHPPAGGQHEQISPALPLEPLLSGSADSASLEIDGRRLKFTNLNKVFYPREGYTKRDVINYYHAVAPLIVPHLKDRPLSLKRYPNGIEGEFFFQKEAAEGFPSWLRIEPIFSEHNQAPIRYVVCDGRASLLYLANLACIDQNPWMSRIGSLENPDFILIDLDPQECSFERIVEATQLIRRKLDVLELEGYPKTTGGDGMHVYIPIEPRYTYEQARTFAEILSRIVSAERPDLFTTPRAVTRREKGKVYFDWAQIADSKTIAAPYVLRAHPGAPVSTPLRWGEVAPGLSPAQFHIGNVMARFARVGDLFRPVLEEPQPLEPAFQRLEMLVRESLR
jgi:bifunctional non-homologous end joining protein LigD